MSVSTEDQGPVTTASTDGWVPLQVLARAVTGLGIVVVMGLYVLVSPLIALGAGLAEVITEIRDTMVRPRPFVGARHGFPFLDRTVQQPAGGDAGSGDDPADE